MFYNDYVVGLFFLDMALVIMLLALWLESDNYLDNFSFPHR